MLFYFLKLSRVLLGNQPVRVKRCPGCYETRTDPKASNSSPGDCSFKQVCLKMLIMAKEKLKIKNRKHSCGNLFCNYGNIINFIG